MTKPKKANELTTDGAMVRLFGREVLRELKKIANPEAKKGKKHGNNIKTQDEGVNQQRSS